MDIHTVERTFYRQKQEEDAAESVLGDTEETLIGEKGDLAVTIDLVFDTETTGFPLWKSLASDPAQPHLVQLAVIMAKGDDLILKWGQIIKCPIEIPEEAANVHGITTERAQNEGISLREALVRFQDDLRTADRVVCHNVNFDFKIMDCAYHRAELDVSLLHEKPNVCTMKTATPLLKLPSRRGYKWPKMIEAYKALVDPEGFGAAHTADADAMACWKVLRALEERGVELL